MDLLFTPRGGDITEENTDVTTDVTLLKTNISVYKRALYNFIIDWTEGKVGVGAPKEEWEKELILKINELENKVEGTDSSEDDLNGLYKDLQKWKVQNHLKIVTSHRKWIRLTQQFLEKTGVVISERIKELVRIHDLSKYTHWESLGYAVMFGDCQADWKQLDDKDEKQTWQNSLDHHFLMNPHHPEYFSPKLPDGSRDKSKGMLESDPDNGEDFLIESLIDMLASRGERALKHDEVFSISKWFGIDDKYMGRYNETDRQYVKDLLEKWKTEVRKLEATDMAEFQGYFDDRAVVY